MTTDMSVVATFPTYLMQYDILLTLLITLSLLLATMSLLKQSGFCLPILLDM